MNSNFMDKRNSAGSKGAYVHDDALIPTIQHKKHLDRNESSKQPSPQLQSDLEARLKRAEDTRGSIYRTISSLQEELAQVERETKIVVKQIKKNRASYESNLQYLFFDYLPSREKNFTDYIGPLDEDMVEASDKIGPYKVCGVVGKGSVASVHGGVHCETGKPFAIKTICKAHLTDLPNLFQFEKELVALQSVRHPNVVQYHEILHAPKNIYVVTELAYCDLSQFLNLCPEGITMETVREVALGVLRALAHLHHRGIAHLDIKMENILIGEKVNISDLNRSHVKLCDFGSCALRESAMEPVRVECISGTVGFIAPEMIISPQFAEGRSADMWSFGATLLDLVVGLDTPWMEAYSYFKEDATKFESSLVRCIEQVRRDILLDYSLHKAICSLLCMDPLERSTASQMLLHDWTRGVTARKVTVARKNKRRNTHN